MVNLSQTHNGLIQPAAAKCGLPQTETAKALSAILETIYETLSKEEPSH